MSSSKKNKNQILKKRATVSISSSRSADDSRIIAELVEQVKLLQTTVDESQARERANQARERTNQAREHANRQLLLVRGIPDLGRQYWTDAGPSINTTRIKTTDPIELRVKPFGCYLPLECREAKHVPLIWQRASSNTLDYSTEFTIQATIKMVIEDAQMIVAQAPRLQAFLQRNRVTPLATVAAAASSSSHSTLDKTVVQSITSCLGVFGEQTLLDLRPDLCFTRGPQTTLIGAVEVKLPVHERTCAASLRAFTASSAAFAAAAAAAVAAATSSSSSSATAATAATAASAKIPARRSGRNKQQPISYAESDGQDEGEGGEGDEDEEDTAILEPMSHESILQQVLDYLVFMRNSHGVRYPMCLLTTYKEWRVLWLPDDQADAFAALDNENEDGANESDLFLQLIAQDRQAAQRAHQVQVAALRRGANIIIHPHGKTKTPKTKLSSALVLHASPVYACNNPTLGRVLVSMMYKMWCGPVFRHMRLLDEGRLYQFVRSDDTTVVWGKAPTGKLVLSWTKLPQKGTINFILLRHLANGLHGRTYLACSTTGACCILKFAPPLPKRVKGVKGDKGAKGDRGTQASSQAARESRLRLEQEAAVWHHLWTKVPVLLPGGIHKAVASNGGRVSVTVIAGRGCLIMPFVYTFRTTRRTHPSGFIKASNSLHTIRHAREEEQEEQEDEGNEEEEEFADDDNDDGEKGDEEAETEEATQEENDDEEEDEDEANPNFENVSYQLTTPNQHARVATRRAENLAQSQSDQGFVPRAVVLPPRSSSSSSSSGGRALQHSISSQFELDVLVETEITIELASKQYEQQAIEACKYMLQRGVYHLDAKPEHVGLLPVIIEGISSSSVASSASSCSSTAAAVATAAAATPARSKGQGQQPVAMAFVPILIDLAAVEMFDMDTVPLDRLADMCQDLEIRLRLPRNALATIVHDQQLLRHRQSSTPGSTTSSTTRSADLSSRKGRRTAKNA